MNFNITGSIVLYKNDHDSLKKAIGSFINTGLVHLYLIDNSPTNELKNIIFDDRVEYIHNPSNPGFGAGHNIAIHLAQAAQSDYHFIINPDIYFHENIVSPMINYMKKHLQIGMLMPEILFPDGRIQNLPKLLPSPISILLRKLKKPAFFSKNFINKYELRFVSRNTIYNAPIISGCFTLLNMEIIKEVGGYDDKFFMYFEDWDLSRRITAKYKTVYFPDVCVYHEYNSGANKDFYLFVIYIKSAIHYFNKWGWIFDKDRKQINMKCLAQFK